MNLGSKNKVNAEASMSSMTDLVFLMLIFFVILSTLISPGIPVSLPKAGASGQPKGSNVTVTVDANKQHYVNNKPIAVEDLEAEIVNALAQPETEQKIMLRVDESVPTGVTVHILDIAKDKNWKIAIATSNE